MNEQCLAEIAEKRGASMYVYDEDILRRQYLSVAAAVASVAASLVGEVARERSFLVAIFGR